METFITITCIHELNTKIYFNRKVLTLTLNFPRQFSIYLTKHDITSDQCTQKMLGYNILKYF